MISSSPSPSIPLSPSSIGISTSSVLCVYSTNYLSWNSPFLEQNLKDIVYWLAEYMRTRCNFCIIERRLKSTH